MVEVEVAGVKVDLRSNAPVLLLQELAEPYRVIPIFIGVPEANAIDLALSHTEVPRPLTHDLMAMLLMEFDVTLAYVVVTEVRNETYYAELLMEVGGIRHRLSARPSDAVALALRMGAPIFVDEGVLNSEGTVLDEGEEEDPEEIVGEFRHFINSVSPEDFAE